MRWTPRRKAEIIHLINTGQLTRAQAYAEHGLSPGELAEWQRNADAMGVKGLKTTVVRGVCHA